MASLNEAVGDGRFISPDVRSLRDVYSSEQLFAMSPDEIACAEKLLQEEAADRCAAELSRRYAGKSCLTTTIHSRVPNKKDPANNFYFDEVYMCQWHKATPRQKKDCPGSSYYSFINECFDKYFIKFDNGVEGIRQEGQFRCPLEVKRLPPPVPFKASDDTIHYYSLVDLPEQYKNSRPGSYNFCPRATLNHIIANCGAVDLSFKEEDGALLMYDSNDTWMKISDQILSFVSDICGPDLKIAAEKYAETVYLREVKKAIL